MSNIISEKEAQMNDIYYELFKIFGEKFDYSYFRSERYLTEFLCSLSKEELDSLDKYSLSIINKYRGYCENINESFANNIFNNPIEGINLCSKDIETLATSEYFHNIIRIIIELKDIYGSSMDSSEFSDLCSYNIFVLEFRRFYQILCNFYLKSQEEKIADILLGSDGPTSTFVLNIFFEDKRETSKVAFALFLSNLIKDSFNKIPIKDVNTNSNNKENYSYEINLGVNSTDSGEYGKAVFSYNTKTCIGILEDLEIISHEQHEQNVCEAIQRIRTNSENLLNK